MTQKINVTQCQELDCTQNLMPMGKRNYKDSNYCKQCATWKPKTLIFCNCCKFRLRINPRRSSPPENIKRVE